MYFCRFADLLTDQDVFEISVPMKLDRRIITPGALSIDFDIANSTVGAGFAKVVPQRTVCHVYRDTIILGSYIIWTKKYTASGSKVRVSIQGATLESYLYRRRLQEDVTYSAVEQLDIAADLLARAQLGIAPYTTSGDLSISSDEFDSGMLRDRTYLQSDANYIGDILEDLANVDAGFEYVIQTYHDGPTRNRVMTFGYDRFVTANPIVIEEPGAIISWDVLYDGPRGATVFWTRGQTTSSDAGEETQPTLSAPAFAEEYLDSGFPIIESINDYQNVSEQDTLDKYAVWWRQNRSGPVMIPSFKVNADQVFRQGFSPFSLGSDVYAILNNPAFPLINGSPSFTSLSRMIGFEITVDNDGGETMSIITETEFDPTEA